VSDATLYSKTSDENAVYVSVVIPTRNRAAQLKRMLDTLLEDDYPFKEIIICDGASTDQTVELLRMYGDRIRWISEPDNGEYDARNKGLKIASGEIIKYMSDDDILLPGVFAYGANYFLEHPDVDILFGQSIWFDQRNGCVPFICDTRPRTKDSITMRNFIRQNYPVANSETVFFRRRVMDQIGLFDMSLHGADYEYWARAAKAGLKLEICSHVIVHYYLSDMSGVICKLPQLLHEKKELARRYGNLSDILYVSLFLIPYRKALTALVRYMPFIGLPLRKAWGRLKARRNVNGIN
jgi:glycosyltransferase involved in cell wall biosynthesis